MKARHAKKIRGVTLLLAIIVISLLLSAGFNLTFVATKELGFSRLASDSVKAHYAAESALECAIFWLFHEDNNDYFEITGTNVIKCNDTDIAFTMDAPVAPSDAYTTTIELGAGTDQYSAVQVQRTPDAVGNYDKKNFILTSEGFNEDASLAVVDPNLVQQELGAIAIESCGFAPSAADTSAPISVTSADLRGTFTTAFGNEMNIANNVGYQTWKLDVDIGATVVMEALFLSSEAGYENTFGFYTNDPDAQYANTNEIYSTNGFVPVFSNREPGSLPANNAWGVPKISSNSASSSDWIDDDPLTTAVDESVWETFEIPIGPGEAIAFAIDTQFDPERTGSNFRLRTTEKYLNSISGGKNQWVLGYLIKEDLWHDPDVPEYVLAFEDQTLSGTANDFDDMVAVIRVQSCVNTFQRL